MTRQTGKVLWVGLLAMVLLALAPYTADAQECTGIFPSPPESTQCTYEHVPFHTFTYANGVMRATWPADYEVLEVHIASDWQDLGVYVPGTVIVLPIQFESRYDFVGRALRVATGETIKFLTPIVCLEGGVPSTLPAPLEGCFQTFGCNVSTDVTCPDGTKRSCSCSGDVGTCSETCSTEGREACCTSSETRSRVDPASGATITETITKKCSNKC